MDLEEDAEIDEQMPTVDLGASLSVSGNSKPKFQKKSAQTLR
jgi:hypothetical protein